jgi:hypothetical protein
MLADTTAQAGISMKCARTDLAQCHSSVVTERTIGTVLRLIWGTF